MTAKPTPPRRWRKRLVTYAIGIFVAWLAGSFVAAYTLTHRAGGPFPEPPPDGQGARFTSFRLDTSDGLQLGAWFHEGEVDQPIVLLLHGNGGCRTQCLPEAEVVAATGAGVLMVSLRAHGDSEGTTNDIGYSSRRDVLAAMAWLGANHPKRPVVIWGRSLGAAAACFAAEVVGDRAEGCILECPYRDLKTAVRHRTQLFLPMGLEWISYMGLRTVAPLVLPDLDRISPERAAAAIPESCRVLILAGQADKLAPPSDAEAIRARVRGRCELIVIEGGEHHQLAKANPEAFRSWIVREIEAARQSK